MLHRVLYPNMHGNGFQKKKIIIIMSDQPALFLVLSIFHIFHGFCRGLFPSCILLMNAGLMKQLVAPESTSPLMSAIALLVLIETGMHIDQNCIVTITELNLWTALTQADGFRHSENPPFLQGLS